MSRTVKVIRAFLIKGERQEVGTVVEVSDALAAELIYGGKAERADAKPAAKGPMTTASASAVVEGARKKKGD